MVEIISSLMRSKEASSKSGSTFKNRSRVEIVANMLTIAQNGALKTHLMYKANLSYLMVTEYLSYLTKSGLIKEIQSEAGKLFRTTLRGNDYLTTYESIRQLAGLDEKKKPASAVGRMHSILPR